MPQSKPNIILIMADDMGYSDIGCFGSEIMTPHINQMASKSVTFTTAYNCARCCPSRASLLTGLYPHKAGIGHMGVHLGTKAYQGYLRDDCLTIAEVLRQAGYRTLMSGKWHVGGSYEPCRADAWTYGEKGFPTPRQRGFDRFYGILDGACSYYHPHHLMEDDKPIKVTTDDFYLTDAISCKAIEMIKESSGVDQPFFLYLAYTAPHWPLHAHPADIEKYLAVYHQNGWDNIRTARHESMQGKGILTQPWQISSRDHQAPPWGDIKNPDWEAARMAVYAAQIECMDRGIGSVLTTLRQLHLMDNTLVVFLSDNGGCAEFMAEDGWARWYPNQTPDGRMIRLGNNPSLRPGGPLTFMSYDLPWANVSNTPFKRFKHWTHEGGISTPLIIQWPAIVKKHRLVHEPVHIIDLMPTFLEAAGASYPSEHNGQKTQDLDGESLMPAFIRENWSRADLLFWEHEGNCAVRSDDWKLVKADGQNWELYEMHADRTEIKDLSECNKSMVKKLERRFYEWATHVGVVEWPQLSEKLKQAWNTDNVSGS